MAPVKRELTNKSLAEKCKTSKDLENRISNKAVAAKYGVPRNTVSTWVKSKRKLAVSLEHSHKKRKDDLETRAVLLILSLEREISGVAVQRQYIKTAKSCGCYWLVKMTSM